MRTVLGVFMALGIFANPNRAFAAARFVDLTAKEYKGSDADLSGLTLSKFGINCEVPGHQAPGYAPWITFDFYSERREPGKQNYGVKRFTIHYRIKSRKGDVVHEEDFEFVKGRATGGQWPYKGRVIVGEPDVHCDVASTHLSKNVDLESGKFFV